MIWEGFIAWPRAIGLAGGRSVARREAWQEFATLLGIALPGFLACSAVFVAIDPIAAGRWRPAADAAAPSLALVTLAAYLAAGLVVAGASADPDVAWGGGGVVAVFSLGILLPVWVGLGPAVAGAEPLFRAVLWLQPVLALGAYLLGVGAVALVRRARAARERAGS
jgi:hypothetical protein